MLAPHTLPTECGEETKQPGLLSEDHNEILTHLTANTNTLKDSYQHSPHLANEFIDSSLAPKVGGLQTPPPNSTTALTGLLQQTSVCERAHAIGHEHSSKTVGQPEGIHYPGYAILQRESNPLVQ